MHQWPFVLASCGKKYTLQSKILFRYTFSKKKKQIFGIMKDFLWKICQIRIYPIHIFIHLLFFILYLLLTKLL